jgi:hypothetical protein
MSLGVLLGGYRRNQQIPAYYTTITAFLRRPLLGYLGSH